ncbi:MAG: redoxin domain-containing protein [Gammaproteobacteria bacterium]|nr:redoxin domain-containing protein [Gammaproteobacteria bacterium]
MLGLTSFSLTDLTGQQVSFPGNRPSLVCFVKEDCPTCRTVMPVLASLYEAFADHVDFFVVGQTADGNQILAEEFKLPFSLLDDSALKVSFATDVETVPTLLMTNAEGHTESERIGFVREEWQALASDMLNQFKGSECTLDWTALPEWRPGCGSLSVDPIHADRLRAEAENSPIRARRIEVGSLDDEFEFMFDQGFSDGLPVIPPTPERVLRMLSGTKRDSQEVVAVMPPNMAKVTVEKIAINAVLAGCKPEYLPVVIASVEAVCTDDFNIHGVMATTMGASPVMVVNGPVRHQIGMNMGLGALGQGNRANATIGRALRLTIRNVGGARPGGTERSTFSNPMKFTMCFAEWEERSCWDPLHVDRGFALEDSVVTVFAMSGGPTIIIDEDSLGGDALAGNIGAATTTMLNARAYGFSNCLMVVSPEHVDTFKRDDYSKVQMRRRMQVASEKTVEQLSELGLTAEQQVQLGALEPGTRLSKFGMDEDIDIVVAGSEAGKSTAFFHGWIPRSIGSIPVSRKIEV